MIPRYYWNEKFFLTKADLNTEDRTLCIWESVEPVIKDLLDALETIRAKVSWHSSFTSLKEAERLVKELEDIARSAIARYKGE